jgi:[glutamine synthetase] adenylyltransferase / [glutamine synthetase]-adenylyl-L-tyrosine phosphorylase
VTRRSRFDTAALPHVGDRAAAERGLARWARLGQASDAPAGDGPVREPLAIDFEGALAAIFGNSPYLGESALAEPDVVRAVLGDGPDRVIEDLIEQTADTPLGPRQRFMATLRRHKRRIALAVALADIFDLWSLEQTTEALSRFADLAIRRALSQTLVEAAQRGDLELEGETDPQASSGIAVLGMGKLGAFELNYSSDLDLIVLFAPERLRCRGRDGPMALAVRLTRAMVYLLEQRTQQGYVFRVDLRLRPHPPGQPLALSIEDAAEYYERHGQNWERAALIKARVVAGEPAVGERLLTWLRPFLWRRHLDFAAIRDIHSIKRQINAHRGHSRIRVAGHDLKVGRGGIREIEFFVQTQQLILGGRLPEVRASATCTALRALAAARWIEPQIADDLIAAYRFLRRLEHRLQMVADKQTHALPERPEQFERFAAFMGYDGTDALTQAVRACLEMVERHYAALFESSIDLGAGGALVFTGTEDDPATIATLADMGFARPEAVAARIRAWHHGHIRACRDTRARELLTDLMPQLLHALAAQAEPDAAFARFDEFVSSLPAGVQLFSLFRANPRLLTLVADLMGTAPRLASHLSRNVSLFDAMLAPDFFEPIPDVEAFAGELDQTLARIDDVQDTLDAVRRFAHDREFQVGLHVLLGLIDGDAAAAILSGIAGTVIRALLPRAEGWLAGQHGRIAGGAFAVFGLGKLGSRELAIGSDLDLIFVYDAPEDARSDGERPLPASTWYARLGQRLVSSLTAKTPEGSLYEIDTRLRPSGHLGPVACSIENFERYQLGTAQTWEHQALTRARFIAGDPELGARVDAVVARALGMRRDPATLGQEVGAMRERIFREHGEDDPWNLKHARGGLIEAEFLAQYFQLRLLPDHPSIRTVSTEQAFLQAAEVGVLRAADARLLVDAVRLYRRTQAVLRLSVQDRFAAEAAPAGLRHTLMRAAHGAGADLPRDDLTVLEEELRATQAAVSEIFRRFCPADG